MISLSIKWSSAIFITMVSVILLLKGMILGVGFIAIMLIFGLFFIVFIYSFMWVVAH